MQEEKSQEERGKSSITANNIHTFTNKVSKELVNKAQNDPKLKEALLEFAKDNKGINIANPENITIKQQQILGEINKIFSKEIKKHLPNYKKTMPEHSEYKTIIDGLTKEKALGEFVKECLEATVSKEELEKAIKEQKDKLSQKQYTIDLRKVNIQGKLYELGDHFGEMFHNNANQLTDEDLNKLNKLNDRNLATNVIQTLLAKGVDCATVLGVSKETEDSLKGKMFVDGYERAASICEATLDKHKQEQKKEENLTYNVKHPQEQKKEENLTDNVKQKVNEIRKKLQENRQRSQSAVPKRKAESIHVDELLNKRSKSQRDNKENRTTERG